MTLTKKPEPVAIAAILSAVAKAAIAACLASHVLTASQVEHFLVDETIVSSAIAFVVRMAVTPNSRVAETVDEVEKAAAAVTAAATETLPVSQTPERV